MFENLASTCEAPDCERGLSEAACMLVYETEEGNRRAYECECGAVTVTVSTSRVPAGDE